MDTMTKVTNLIKGNPQHCAQACRHFEKLFRDDMKANREDAGNRRVYFALSRQLSELYPVKFPESADVPSEAWDDEKHPYWTSDPYTLFSSVYDRLKDEYGWTDAHVLVSTMQSEGKDLLDYVPSTQERI